MTKKELNVIRFMFIRIDTTFVSRLRLKQKPPAVGHAICKTCCLLPHCKCLEFFAYLVANKPFNRDIFTQFVDFFRN